MLAVGAVVLAIPATASAYTHNWSCNSNPGNRCFDSAGQTYNPWLGLTAFNNGGYVQVLCTKGITAAGNVRAGNDPCAYAGSATYPVTHHNCLVSPNPASHAYSYQGGGGYHSIGGRASTDGC